MLLFELLTKEQKRETYQAGELLRKPARTLLIHQGQPANGIFIIGSGIVESVYYTKSDRELKLARWGKNDFIGAPNVFGNAHQQWSARAITPFIGLHLDQACLRKMITNDAEFAIKLIEALGHKGERYSELAQRLAFHTVSERLALKLLDSWEQAQVQKPAKRFVQLPSLLELSQEIGCTRQATGAAIKALQDRGLLNINQGHFHVPRVESLRDVVKS